MFDPEIDILEPCEGCENRLNGSGCRWKAITLDAYITTLLFIEFYEEMKVKGFIEDGYTRTNKRRVDSIS